MRAALQAARIKGNMKMRTRHFIGWFLTPAVLVAIGFAAVMFANLQYGLREHLPGSLDVGGFTFDNFTAIVKNPIYAQVFLDTVIICFFTALFSLLLGYPLAYALVNSESRWIKSAILIISITPLFLGEVVRTYSWILVLGNSGFFNSTLMALGIINRPLQLMFTMQGVTMALVHVTLPIIVIMLAVAIAHIDQDYRKAAASLGAGPIRVFLTVTLPLSIPGILAGTLTAFAVTFSAFATPSVIGGGKVNMVSNLVYQLGLASFNFPFAASLSLSSLVLILVLVGVVGRASKSVERLAEH